MKNFFKSILVLAIIFLFAQINLTAQNWEQMDGPYGGAVKQLTAHKNYLYALTYEQIYRSSDDGTTWKNVPTTQGLTNANAITSQNGMLFLATTNFGILRSTDDGTTWEKQNNGLITDINVTNVISNGTTLLARTDKYVLYRSTNDGINWNVCVYDSINTNQPLYSCNLMKTDGLNFYILANSPSSYSNVYSSSDNGNSWKKLLPDTSSVKQTASLNMAKDFVVNNSVMSFCGMSNLNTIESTTDFGKTWIKTPKKFIYNNITCLINAGSTIIAGLNRYASSFYDERGYSFIVSKDNGESWDTLNIQYRNIESLFQYKNYLFATTYGEEGILRSSDNGLNWEQSNNGLNAQSVNFITFQNKSKLVKVVRPVPYYSRLISTILYKSKNNMNWEKYQDTLFPKQSHLIVSDDSLIVKTDSGIFLTDDFGKSWILQSSKTFTWGLYYANNLLISTNLIKDSSKNYEILKSMDLGKNWTLSTSTFTNKFSELTYFNNIYYAIIDEDVVMSADSGHNWQSLGLKNNIQKLLSNSNHIFASNSANVYRQKSNGNDWDSLKLPGNTEFGISFYTSNKNLFCFSTLDYQTALFKSTNNGDTWENLNISFLTNNVMEITFDNEKLYFGTRYSGIWTLDLTKTDVENNSQAQQNELVVYPNPSQGKFIVEHRNVKFSSNLPVKYSLKSITGQEVLSLISSDEKLEIKTDNFPSGIYYLTAEQNSSNVIQMITIAK